MRNTEDDLHSNDKHHDEGGLTAHVLKSLYAAPNPVVDDIFLAGMNDIQWADLSHAYGEATDVPSLLRALLSHNSDHRDFALELLFQTIWHQGTVYAASAYTVPFLTQLLVHQETPNKTGILYLLASLADGHSYIAVHERTEEDIARAREWLAKDGIDFDTQLHEELTWVRKSRAAVLAGVPIFLQLLDHSDREVQVFARYTLSHLTEAATTIIPHLRARLARDDESMRGNTLLALDALAPIATDDSHVFEHIYREERNEALRTLVAFALLKRQGTNVRPDISNDLIRASTVLDTNPDHRYDTWAIDARFYPGPWGSDHAVDLAHAFASLGLPVGVQLLLRALAGITSSDITHIFVESLLDLVFGGKQLEVPAAYSRTKEGRRKIEYFIRQHVTPHQRASLDPYQLAALKSIINNVPFWGIESNLLELYGLPSSSSSLQEWLSNNEG